MADRPQRCDVSASVSVGGQVRRALSLNCHSSGSLLAIVDNTQSREMAVRPDWSQQLALLARLQHILDVLRLLEAPSGLFVLRGWLPTGLLFFLGDS